MVAAPRRDPGNAREGCGRRLKKAEIKAEWNYTCAYCGTHDRQAMTLDHIIPKSTGGYTCRSNLIPACQRCNSRKASNPWQEWHRAQSFHTDDREAAILHWIETGTKNP